MEADKQEWKTLKNAIEEWEQKGLLSHEKAGELRKTVELKRTARQEIAKYFFLFAISCALLAFGAIFLDEKLLEKLKAQFALSNLFIAITCTALTIAWFWYIRRKSVDTGSFVYEVYMVLGGLLSLTALVYICKDIGMGPSNSIFLFLAFLLLMSISIGFRSKALWVGSILALMAWYGSFSNYYSLQNMFLGMNYPVRFAAFGAIITGLSLLQLRVPKLLFTQRLTYLAGLIIFFTGMWGVSIFGNYGHLDEWAMVRQTQVLIYAFLFALAGALAFYLGIVYKDDTTRDFGILFILLNLYSRYFEFFWDSMNKGIFFLILAISFFFIGRWIERRKRMRRIKLKLPF